MSVLFLVHDFHLDGSLSRWALPNLQVTIDLRLERSDATATILLLVSLPCDFYFLQVDHINYVLWFRIINSCAANAWRALIQLLF